MKHSLITSKNRSIMTNQTLTFKCRKWLKCISIYTHFIVEIFCLVHRIFAAIVDISKIVYLPLFNRFENCTKSNIIFILNDPSRSLTFDRINVVATEINFNTWRKDIRYRWYNSKNFFTNRHTVFAMNSPWAFFYVNQVLSLHFLGQYFFIFSMIQRRSKISSQHF